MKSFKDPRIRIYKNHTHMGIGRNWNKCIEFSTGKYITIFHQDDILLPTSLEKRVAVLDKHKDIGLVHSGYYNIAESNKIISCHRKENRTEFFEKGLNIFLRLIAGKNFINAPTVLVRKECFKNSESSTRILILR